MYPDAAAVEVPSTEELCRLSAVLRTCVSGLVLHGGAVPRREETAGRGVAGSSRSASAAILRKKQPAPVPAADVAAAPQDVPSAKGKAPSKKKAAHAPAGQDGVVEGQLNEDGVPVKKRRAPRRPPRRQRGKISAMVNDVFVEAELFDSDDSEGGYDVVMQRRACRRVRTPTPTVSSPARACAQPRCGDHDVRRRPVRRPECAENRGGLLAKCPSLDLGLPRWTAGTTSHPCATVRLVEIDDCG